MNIYKVGIVGWNVSKFVLRHNNQLGELIYETFRSSTKKLKRIYTLSSNQKVTHTWYLDQVHICNDYKPQINTTTLILSNISIFRNVKFIQD